MAKYKIYGNYVFSKYLGEFEANTKEEAIEKALYDAEDSIELCASCSNQFEDRGYLDEESCMAEVVGDNIQI